MMLAFMGFSFYLYHPFIRQVKKKNSSTGKAFYQYQLLQAARVGEKVKHQNILYRGSDHDWRNIVRIMNTQTVQELLLPIEKRKISIVKPSRPIKEALDISPGYKNQVNDTSKEKICSVPLIL